MITIFINLLTLFRILIGPVIFLLLMSSDKYLYVVILFFLAGLTDYFDGFLARKYEATSDIGEILDPVADKILITFVIIGLSVSLKSFFIGFFGSMIIAREIWVAALRDYNSRTNNTIATKVTFLAKLKTTFQIITITIYFAGLYFNSMLTLIIGDVSLIISFLITWYTGAIYTYRTLN